MEIHRSGLCNRCCNTFHLHYLSHWSSELCGVSHCPEGWWHCWTVPTCFFEQCLWIHPECCGNDWHWLSYFWSLSQQPSNRISVVFQKSIAVIFFVELSFTNFFLEEVLCVLPYHGVDNLSPLMPHWLIRSRSYACTINLYTSDCGIWLALVSRMESPSCSQECHEKFHVLLLVKCWDVLWFPVFSCVYIHG